jgi:hypothetical protein
MLISGWRRQWPKASKSSSGVVSDWRRLLVGFKIIISECATKSVNIPLVDRTAGFIMHNCFCSGWRKTIGEVGCGWQWCQQAFCGMCCMNKTLTTKELSPWSCLYNLLLAERYSLHNFFFTQTKLRCVSWNSMKLKYEGDVSFSSSLVVNLRQATCKTIARQGERCWPCLKPTSRGMIHELVRLRLCIRDGWLTLYRLAVTIAQSWRTFLRARPQMFCTFRRIFFFACRLEFWSAK